MSAFRQTVWREATIDDHEAEVPCRMAFSADGVWLRAAGAKLWSHTSWESVVDSTIDVTATPGSGRGGYAIVPRDAPPSQHGGCRATGLGAFTREIEVSPCCTTGWSPSRWTAVVEESGIWIRRARKSAWRYVDWHEVSAVARTTSTRPDAKRTRDATAEPIR